MFTNCRNPIRVVAAIGCVCCLSVFLSRSSAGQFRTVESGDRIRFTIAESDSSRIVAGRFRVAARDSLYLFPDRSSKLYAQVAQADLGNIEVHTGTTRRTGRGAFLGLAAGSILGAGIGAIAEPCTPTGERLIECLTLPTTRGGTMAFGAIGGGLAGLILGAIAGNTIVQEHWEPGILTPTDANPPEWFRTPRQPVLPADRSSEVTLTTGNTWSINVGFGTPAHVSDDLHAALSHLGYGDDQICDSFFCFGDVSFPITTGTSSGFQIAVHRTLGTTFDAGLRYTRAKLGETTGYDATTLTNLSITPEVGFTEAVARLKGASRFHLAAGVGTYRLSLAERSRSPGVFVEWGLELIRFGNAYIFVEGRYRKVSSMNVELLDDRVGGTYSGPGLSVDSKVDLSSRSGVIGFGLHL